MNLLYHILNYQDNTNYIRKAITPSFKFDSLYQLASAHSVLPALYNAIIAKDLVAIFPKDFIQALQYFTNLNQERNKSITQQVTHIAKLFNANQINYVFLKGNAMLINNYYRKSYDRMVVDVDILVAKDHLNKANNLLIQSGYKPADYTIKMYFTKHRHLPRLTSKNWICAVELHESLLSKPQKLLKPKSVLSNKVFNGIFPLPNNTHLAYHAIFSDQINDFGYLKWEFTYRTLFDVLTLKHKDSTVNLDESNKYIRRFLLLKQLYFKDQNITPNLIERLKIKFVKWRFKNKKANKFYYYLIVKWSTIGKLPVRFVNLFINKTYRNFTINKLKQFVKKTIPTT